MKIAIASNDGKEISKHFGQSEGFVIVNIADSGEKSLAYIKNTFTNHALGKKDSDDHENKHDAILSALSGCKAVISNGMGMKIYNDLNGVGIRPIISDETNVETALELFLSDKLTDHPNRGCRH
jgi:predicted Fe-Mo cluster-binding NifX family protein